ncbi:MAG TPA: CinA family protein [Ruminococcus bromii]|nr:CinA family protein [Ruminococcus bromii]
MITLTDTDVVRLLRKNNLNSDTLQENVVAKLREKGVKLATAESCTGGLLSERITAVSGASDVFDFGVCTYANEMKHKVLGVSNETLSVLGAVSAETAMQMAEGARNVSGADLAVSTTGIAGPTGGNTRKACRSCLLRNQHKRQKLCNKAYAWRQY